MAELQLLTSLRVEPRLSAAPTSSWGWAIGARGGRRDARDPPRGLVGHRRSAWRVVSGADSAPGTSSARPRCARRRTSGPSLVGSGLLAAAFSVPASVSTSERSPRRARSYGPRARNARGAGRSRSTWSRPGSPPRRPAAARRRARVVDADRELPIVAGMRALWALRGVRGALERWARACGPREVLLASPRSFCAGVERAIEIVELALERYGAPVYVRKQIVHNEHVVEGPRSDGRRLRRRARRGAGRCDRRLLRPRRLAGRSRRGCASPGLERHRRDLPARGQGARRGAALRRRGTTSFLIGHADHEEVEGTIGEAPEPIPIVEGLGDVAALDLEPLGPSRT